MHKQYYTITYNLPHGKVIYLHTKKSYYFRHGSSTNNHTFVFILLLVRIFLFYYFQIVQLQMLKSINTKFQVSKSQKRSI